jgi:hypothetical protein
LQKAKSRHTLPSHPQLAESMNKRSRPVNASASALARDVEVQSKIRKVSFFSRYARVVCSAIFGFGVVGGAFYLLLGTLNVLGWVSPAVDGGVGLTPQQKMWALPMFALAMSAWLAAIYHLTRLFGSLATGAIYTAENVRRVRHVGLLWMLSAVLGLLIPFVWAGLVASGVVEESNPPRLESWFSWPSSVNGMVSAGLVLLISWIMDVGLYEKDHADALQRDADLVI